MRKRFLVYTRTQLGGFSPQIHYDGVKKIPENLTSMSSLPAIELGEDDPHDLQRLIRKYPPPSKGGGHEAARSEDPSPADGESKGKTAAEVFKASVASGGDSQS